MTCYYQFLKLISKYQKTQLVDKLTPKNFSSYAMKHYDDPQCEDIEDFKEDLRRFRYLKRLLHRYHDLGELREDLC